MNDHMKKFLSASTFLLLVMPALVLFSSMAFKAALPAPQQSKSLIWKLENPAQAGSYQTEVLGSPAAQNTMPKSVFFDGVDDGMIVPVNPVQNWKSFTVEVLFNPAADGPAAPRFMHFEDSAGRRGTLELRVTRDGRWYADTFLKNGRTDKGLTLIDSTRLHPCGQWYWLALVYDGHQMRDFVNGAPELAGEVRIDPMSDGQISLGVRLNHVSWFKGNISEVRFHPAALSAGQLQRF